MLHIGPGVVTLKVASAAGVAKVATAHAVAKINPNRMKPSSQITGCKMAESLARSAAE